MSDILIKGMEMPKNEPLLVKINPDGSVSTTAKNGYKKYEAVPVPPHGDLVDRDGIIESGKSHPTYKNSKIVKAVVDKACCLLKTATVVIPANGEE